MVAGYQAITYFGFFENKLHQGSYSISSIYTIDRGIEIFIDLRNKLKTLYGDNTYVSGERIITTKQDNITNEKIIESLRQSYTSTKGSKSYFVFTISWDYRKTSINMKFSYNDYLEEYEIYIEYNSPNYGKDLSEARNKKKGNVDGL